MFLSHGCPKYAILYLLALFVSCVPEEGPQTEEFPIYVNYLSPGFDIGIASSENRYDWLDEREGFFRMAYPGGCKSGSVFIVAGAVALESVTEDFSAYRQLAVDLRSELGEAFVSVSIEDSRHSYVHPQFALDVPKEWKTYYFLLSGFKPEVDLARLRTLIKFSFCGEQPLTVDFRNVKYLRTDQVPESQSTFPLYLCNTLPIGYNIGVAQDTVSNAQTVQLDTLCDFLRIRFPAGKIWSSVFLYPLDGRSQDFSSFDTLIFEIRGENGGEVINVGVRDTSKIWWNTKYTLQTTSWRAYQMPLQFLEQINYRQVLNPITFTSNSRKEQTVYVRNVYFK